MDTTSRTRRTSQRRNFSLTRKLINAGLAKNEQQATYILIGVVVVSMLIAVWVLHSGSSETPPIDSITTPDVLPQQ